MIFSLSSLGNIGNRMLVYMVARAVAGRLSSPVTFNVDLPEWGMPFDLALHEQLLADKTRRLLFNDVDGTSLDEMVAQIEAAAPEAVVFNGYFQHFALLREVEFYRECFPLQPLDIAPFAEDEIVINIRAGELLDGIIAWYPLVPPLFYHMLCAHTGWRPVLLGQLDDCVYMREILRLCPGARLLPSAGAMVDFNRLRHAKRLCMAVSTFSWAASWLSDAVEIHYPLLGFLHPFSMPQGWNDGGGVDLTPEGDARYLYHLFPMMHAALELEYLRHAGSLTPISQPVSAAFAAGLSAKAKLLAGTIRGVSPAAGRYLRHYPEAAWSIAQGQYGSAQEHFEQLGRSHGYKLHFMRELEWRHQRPNLALGKPALQSSVSKWSRRPTREADAAGAVSGVIDEFHAFHTDVEDAPWWRVDLGALCDITEIWLFNRIDQDVVIMRAARLAVDIGSSEADYAEVFRYDCPTPFGGADGGPLIISFDSGVEGRFVRVRLLHRTCLHLNQVEIYGKLCS